MLKYPSLIFSFLGFLAFLHIHSEYLEQENLKFDIVYYPLEGGGERKKSDIKALILHAVGQEKTSDILRIFEESGLNAHYLVPFLTAQELKKEIPQLFKNSVLRYPHQVPVIRMVKDERIAFHAGKSHFADLNELPRCEGSLNACSIGIEFHLPGYADFNGSNWYSFVEGNKKQRTTGIKLIKFLMEKYKILPRYLLAHSTVSVGRKTDPGPSFFWKKISRENGGTLASAFWNYSKKGKKQTVEFVQKKLHEIGFRGCPQTGVLDEETQLYIDAYVMQYAPFLWKGKGTPLTKKLLGSLVTFGIQKRVLWRGRR